MPSLLQVSTCIPLQLSCLILEQLHGMHAYSHNFEDIVLSSYSACLIIHMRSAGDMRHKLEPVSELLPFEGDLLDEDGVHRGAEAFSEALVPEHAAHGQTPLWWSQGAAQKGSSSALLVPDMPMRPAFSGQSMMGHGWASHMVRQLMIDL